VRISLAGVLGAFSDEGLFLGSLELLFFDIKIPQLHSKE
jgi:hypothetical protein